MDRGDIPRQPGRSGRSRHRVVAALAALAIIAGAAGCASEADVQPSSAVIEAPASSTTPSVASPSSTPVADTSESSISVAPTVAAGPAVMSPSPPVRVEIPAIGVDSGLLTLGLMDDGTLEVPPDGTSAGWYDGAPTPGELGPAIIVGHVDWGGDEGVFFNLRDLQPDDQVKVTREDGSIAVFRVSTVDQTPKSEFPTDAVYGNIDHAGLRLITCGGEFDRGARSYVDSIIVYADLV